jgi:hypothetical protein
VTIVEKLLANASVPASEGGLQAVAAGSVYNNDRIRDRPSAARV